MATKKQLDELFVKAVAGSITHTKEFQARYWYKNLACPALFGEFITALRRELVPLSNVTTDLKSFCGSICKKDAWVDVGRPQYQSSRYAFKWNVSIITEDGVWEMNYYKAEQLCRQAGLQSKYETTDQNSVEISVGLSRLEQQLKEANAAVGVAASLNKEADTVCNKLCEIAESLQVA